MKNTTKLNKDGFTIIEILVVITIIGILMGIALSVINPQAARNKAKNGVRISKVSGIAESLEIFRVTSGFLPHVNVVGDIENPTGDGNPFTGNDAAVVSQHISKWPDDSEYIYSNITEGSQQYLCVSTRSATATDTTTCPYIVYISPWDVVATSGIEDCSGKVLLCPNPCVGNSNDNNIEDCVTLQEESCSSSATANCSN